MILFMWRLMMTKRIPMKGGDEYDGLTKARKFFLTFHLCSRETVQNGEIQERRANNQGSGA